ncbi:MAG: thiamine diphosphokinase [Firmicutes bacterium]|nr:thiamine diphosphokinase [Bacillota bacterium]
MDDLIRRAYIFSHGRLVSFPAPTRDMLTIAADGGARHLLRVGCTPDIVIGDFDSLGPDELDTLAASGCRVIRYPAAKDQTDTQLAVEFAIEEGATDLTLYGGLGSRLDHSMANVMLLALIHERGCTGRVTDGEQVVQLLVDEMTVSGAAGDVVSILPLTPVLEGLTIKGLKYPLQDATIRMGDSRTISNEFGTPGTGTITLRSGVAMVVQVPMGGA